MATLRMHTVGEPHFRADQDNFLIEEDDPFTVSAS